MRKTDATCRIDDSMRGVVDVVFDIDIAHLRNTPLRHSERETLITLAFDLEGISKHERSKYQECL